MDKIPDNILKIIQGCIALRPVIVLGSGASCQYGIPGMKKLLDFLLTNINPENTEETDWNKFKEEIINGSDLETALQKISLSSSLENKIIIKTRELIFNSDIEILNSIVNSDIEVPLAILLEHLARTANPEIKIITTNYDKLAEYAIDKAHLNFNDGFVGKYIKGFEGFHHNKASINNYHIDLLKVHGSIDWFLDSKNNVISLNTNSLDISGLIPLMVTPGIKKYEHTHYDPFRSIIAESDKSFDNAPSILCIGYGFNDKHIQPNLIKRVKKKKIPVIILAKTLSNNAKRFIDEATFEGVIGIEANNHQSRIVTSKHGSVDIDNSSYWNLSEFLKLII